MDVKNAIPVSAPAPSGSRAVELSRRTCRNRVRRDSFCSRERWSGAVGRRVLTEGTSTLYSRRLFNTTHTAATKLCPIKRSRGRKHRSSSHLLLEQQAARAQPPFQKLSPQPTLSSKTAPRLPYPRPPWLQQATCASHVQAHEKQKPTNTRQTSSRHCPDRVLGEEKQGLRRGFVGVRVRRRGRAGDAMM